MHISNLIVVCKGLGGVTVSPGSTTTLETDLSNEGTSESAHKEKDYSYLDVATTLEHDFIKEATPEYTNKEIELQKVKEELESSSDFWSEILNKQFKDYRDVHQYCFYKIKTDRSDQMLKFICKYEFDSYLEMYKEEPLVKISMNQLNQN